MWTWPYAVLLLSYTPEFIFMCAVLCHLCSCLPFRRSTVDSHDFKYSINYSQLPTFRFKAIRHKVRNWKTSQASTNVGFSWTESPRLFSRLLPLAIFALDYHFGVRQSSHKITNKLAHDTWTRKRGTKLSEVRKTITNRSKRHMHRYKAVPEFLLGVPTFHLKGETGIHTLCLFKSKKDEAKLHSTVFSSLLQICLPCPSWLPVHQ